MRRAGYMLILSAFVSFIICTVFSGRVTSEYSPILAYPLIFAVMGALIMPLLHDRHNGGRVTVTILFGLQWLRAVFLPAIGTVSGYFSSITSNIDSVSATQASWLFIYELFATFIAAFLVLKYSRKMPDTEIQITGIRGSVSIYFLYIVFAIILYITRGRGLYSFFRLSLTGTRASRSVSDTGLVITSMIDYGLAFLVIVLLYYFYKKYTETDSKKYMWMALGVSLVRLCIISSYSEGRLSIVYLFGTFVLLLPILFQKYRPTIIRSVTIIAIAVIGMMTIYKTFRAFAYSSYSLAIASGASDFNAQSISNMIDIYFYGVRDIARNISISKQINLNFGTFFTDLFRNTFGIHYLFRGSENTTVALYNLYIYNGLNTAGNLYSSLAYGSSYFSPVLAPLATVFNIVFATWIENKLHRVKDIDIYYVVSVAYIRLAATMFCCFPMGWNYASRSLILGFVVIGFGSILRKRKEKRSTGYVYRTERQL